MMISEVQMKTLASHDADSKLNRKTLTWVLMKVSAVQSWHKQIIQSLYDDKILTYRQHDC